MVTVKNYHVRQKEGEQGTFISLELMGDIELIQSSNTGRFYATVRKCFISASFDEEVAKMMVGRQLEGNIARVECEQYEFTIPETSEVVMLGYRWDYVPTVVNSVSAKQSLVEA